MVKYKLNEKNIFYPFSRLLWLTQTKVSNKIFILNTLDTDSVWYQMISENVPIIMRDWLVLWEWRVVILIIIRLILHSHSYLQNELSLKKIPMTYLSIVIIDNVGMNKSGKAWVFYSNLSQQLDWHTTKHHPTVLLPYTGSLKACQRNTSGKHQRADFHQALFRYSTNYAIKFYYFGWLFKLYDCWIWTSRVISAIYQIWIF